MFMQKQIYRAGYYEVDTSCGTEIVPADVCNLIGDPYPIPVAELCALGYLEGKPFDLAALAPMQTGWLARMSAPGYMDCTSWGVYKTAEEASADLDAMYGDDNEDDC